MLGTVVMNIFTVLPMESSEAKSRRHLRTVAGPMPLCSIPIPLFCLYMQLQMGQSLKCGPAWPNRGQRSPTGPDFRPDHLFAFQLSSLIEIHVSDVTSLCTHR